MKKLKRVGGNTPASFSGADLNPFGTAVVPAETNSETVTFECLACCESWGVHIDRWQNIPTDFWECPHGCNEVINKRISSDVEAVLCLGLISQYLVGYVKKVQTVQGVKYVHPDETLQDVFEELLSESPDWRECVDALRSLLDHAVAHDISRARPESLLAARQTLGLLADYHPGPGRSRLFWATS